MHEKRGYRIASFNIEKFGDKAIEFRGGKNGRKDLAAIAEMIESNQIDILAIQEISHQYALKALLEQLSSQSAKEVHPAAKSSLTREVYGYCTSTWEGRWAKPVSKYSDRAAEGYAFIWKRSRIKLVTNYEGESFEPRIGFNLRHGKLVRSPFVGRFMPINARYEFRIINMHFAWGKPISPMGQDVEEAADETSKALREQELQTIFDTVYTSLEKQHYDVNNIDKNARPLSPYTFLLGDYNLNLPGKGIGAKMSKELSEYECGNLKIITVNGELTTLKKVPKDAEKAKKLRNDPNPQNHLANNYDHFSYDRNRLVENEVAEPVVFVVPAYEEYKNNKVDYQQQFDDYREKVSDHLPVVLDIDIREKR
jgi:hypothetical protein